jgi:hypothetical protein
MSHSLVLVLLLLTTADGSTRTRELTYTSSSRTESVRLYGNTSKFAYWFADLLVGTPPQRTSVIVDTGSVVCAFPCSSCGSHCGEHLDPPFDFTASTTAEWETCDADCRGTCTDGKCSYHVSYSEGSSITGTWFNDVVQLGGSNENNVAVRSQVGCHVSETKLFYSQSVNGILGMAPPRAGSFPTILGSLFTDPSINKFLFSLCLSPEGGDLTIGGFNTDYVTDEIIWVPMGVDMFYTIPLVSLTLGGSEAPNSFGRVIVDSGTTLVFVPGKVYTWLVSRIESSIGGILSSAPERVSPKCWDMKSEENIDNLNEIIFSFSESMSVSWSPYEYLYHTSGTTWCYSFGDNGSVNETILGAVWLVGKLAVFDIDGKRMGIGQKAKCPRYVAREAEEGRPVTTTTTSVSPKDMQTNPPEETTNEPPESPKEAPFVKAAAEEEQSTTTTATPSDPSTGYLVAGIVGWSLVLVMATAGTVLFFRRNPDNSVNDIELGSVINNNLRE